MRPTRGRIPELSSIRRRDSTATRVKASKGNLQDQSEYQRPVTAGFTNIPRHAQFLQEISIRCRENLSTAQRPSAWQCMRENTGIVILIGPRGIRCIARKFGQPRPSRASENQRGARSVHGRIRAQYWNGVTTTRR